MSIFEIKPNEGEKKNRKRVGRGTGNGRGKTCTRGHKGQNSRSGGGVPAWFEGGQMPLYRRIPKKGFKSLNHVYFNLVNLKTLSEFFKENDTVNVESLLEKGLIKSNGAPVKLLASGELTVKGLKVSVHAASEAAVVKLEKAGGSIELIK